LRAHDINCGPDLGGTGHAALNFTGGAGAAGDTWITVFDTTPKTPDQTIFMGSVSLSADVLIHRFNNKKGAGLLALYNEGAGRKGLVLIVYDNGNTDTLVLATVDQTGKLTALRSVALDAGILENVWYRLTMDVTLIGGTTVSVMGKVVKHLIVSDPTSDLGEQVGSTLSFAGPLPAGVDTAGEVGIVASAISAVVDSSVTNFEVSQD
jgi:hypothetical protein